MSKIILLTPWISLSLSIALAPTTFAATLEKSAGRANPRIAMESYKLANGLRVVLAPDSSVPVTALATLFDVGSRQEPHGRSGFAHLFEHLMFEGSAHAPKGVFDRLLESYGGDNNASTHKDLTFYYEITPSNALPIALWLDADRLSALSITEEARLNQISVVKEEKRMSIDNQPYAPALYDEMSSRSFKNWQNAHSTMGSFQELEAASHKDTVDFFNAYYAPANAVMTVVGDFNPAQAKKWINDYFSWIPNRGKPVPVDTREPAGFAYSQSTIQDAHANLPALALTWKGMPERGQAPDFYALVMLDSLLFSGKSSLLYLSLVKDKQVAVSAEGGLGFPESNYTDYRTPALFGCFIIYKQGKSAKDIRDLVEAVIQDIVKNNVQDAALERVKTKFRSDWIRSQQTAYGRAWMIARAALLDNDPQAANNDLERYMAVKPVDIQAAAAKYLTRERQMLLDIQPVEAR